MAIGPVICGCMLPPASTAAALWISMSRYLGRANGCRNLFSRHLWLTCLISHHKLAFALSLFHPPPPYPIPHCWLTQHLNSHHTTSFTPSPIIFALPSSSNSFYPIPTTSHLSSSRSLVVPPLVTSSTPSKPSTKVLSLTSPSTIHSICLTPTASPLNSFPHSNFDHALPSLSLFSILLYPDIKPHPSYITPSFISKCLSRK